MRAYFEEREFSDLASYAVKSALSKGRRYDEPPSDTRTCFQRDRDRIIHANAFRRLKHKTQVFIANESDHYRSRLTHTLEVAQISRHLARLLRVNEDLSEAIALAHDLGHTPFGHSGERALHELMQDHGGFEHNLQSRRIVDELESKYPNFPGLNLSYEVREGLLKHKTQADNAQVEGNDGFMSLEAQICNLADEIAYNNHDLDDGLRAKLIHEEDLIKHVTLWKEADHKVRNDYQNLTKKQRKTLINSHLISVLIESVLSQSLNTIQKENIQTLDDIQAYRKSIITYTPEIAEKNKELRKYLFTHFYSHAEIYRMNKKGQQIIQRLFPAFLEDIRLLPSHFRERIMKKEDATPKERVIADYIAGMTDGYALKEYNEIFV